MRVNIKFFLTWLPCPDFWWKELIKFCNSLNITAWLISIIGMIEPFSAVESIITEHFYKQSSRENIALKTDIVLFTAFIATDNVIIGITEVYNSIISHFLYDFKGMFKHSLTISHTLIIRVNANRTHRND